MNERSTAPAQRGDWFAPRRYFAVAGVLLGVALAAIAPSSSEGLGLPSRLLFWWLHAAAALIVLVFLQRQIEGRVRLGAWPVWGRVLLVGVIGGVLFVPLSLGIEAMWPEQVAVEDEPESLAGEVVEEFALAVPQVVLFWALINLPWLAPRRAVVAPSPAERPASADGVVQPPAVVSGSFGGEEASAALQSSTSEDAPADAPRVGDPPGDDEGSRSAVTGTELREAGASDTPFADWLAALSPHLGSDLLALSAELHYVRVITAAGSELLLGSLQALSEAADAPEGERIHRSHWIAWDGVEDVVRKGGAWWVQLRDGSELPISRRRVRAVRDAWEARLEQ